MIAKRFTLSILLLVFLSGISFGNDLNFEQPKLSPYENSLVEAYKINPSQDADIIKYLKSGLGKFTDEVCLYNFLEMASTLDKEHMRDLDSSLLIVFNDIVSRQDLINPQNYQGYLICSVKTLTLLGKMKNEKSISFLYNTFLSVDFWDIDESLLSVA